MLVLHHPLHLLASVAAVTRNLDLIQARLAMVGLLTYLATSCDCLLVRFGPKLWPAIVATSLCCVS